jgi:pterin-4a-carbinolamine dehydratase
MMTLKKALDWQTISAKLRKDLAQVSHNPDLKQVYKNIEVMVSELSKNEVIARQTKRDSMLASQVDRYQQEYQSFRKTNTHCSCNGLEELIRCSCTWI